MLVKITIPMEVLESIKKIVDYSIKDEEKHYEECELDDPDRENHIFNDLELVNRFIHSQDLQAEIDAVNTELPLTELVKYMRIAMAMTRIGMIEKDIYKVIRIYQMMQKVGGEMSLKDAVSIECEADRVYDVKPEFTLKGKKK